MRALTMLLLLLAASAAWCQVREPSVGNPEQPQKDKWAYEFDVTGVLVPDDRSYASPTFYADRGHIHFETRYNYEDLETGSIFAGYNISKGTNFTAEATPMLGGVFGNTNGIAPAYNLELGYRKLALSSNGEYVIPTGNVDNRYFYSWNEFVYSPAEWFHAGLVAQRTRAYHTSLDVQRGFSVGVAHKAWDFTVYTLNPGWEQPTIEMNLRFSF